MVSLGPTANKETEPSEVSVLYDLWKTHPLSLSLRTLRHKNHNVLLHLKSCVWLLWQKRPKTVRLCYKEGTTSSMIYLSTCHLLGHLLGVLENTWGLSATDIKCRIPVTRGTAATPKDDQAVQHKLRGNCPRPPAEPGVRCLRGD